MAADDPLDVSSDKVSDPSPDSEDVLQQLAFLNDDGLEKEEGTQMDQMQVYATTEYDCVEEDEEVDKEPLRTALPPDEDESERVTPNNRTFPWTDADTMSIAGGEG